MSPDILALPDKQKLLLLFVLLFLGCFLGV